MAVDQHTAIDAIASREDFIHFVHELVRTLDQAPDGHPEGWEPCTLRDFLEAMAAWTEDMDGYFQNRGEPFPEEPTWSLFGHILKAATLYE